MPKTVNFSASFLLGLEFFKQMLNRFSCIALAGVATEYLLFGYSEGGLADIDKASIKFLTFSLYAQIKISFFSPDCFFQCLKIVGYIAQELGFHTEESRFSGKMGCAEHNFIAAPP